MLKADPGTAKNPSGHHEILEGDEDSEHGNIVEEYEQDGAGDEEKEKGFMPFKVPGEGNRRFFHSMG
jgi:hypothetical protein